jgi:glycosyltransferase involved in cell wall biosynthesis
MVVPHFLPHVGGGEQLYFDIAKGLAEEGYEVRVVTSSSAGVYGNVPYQGIDTYYYTWKMFCGHPIVKSKDISEHIKWADLVHTTMFTTATKTRLMAKKYGKPCVITIHEVLGNKWFWIEKSKIKALMFDFYERFICRQLFDAYHVVSDATKKDYEHFCGKKRNVIRIHNSIELPDIKEVEKEDIELKEYFELKDGEKSFLYFGRPAPNKGVFVLEEAIHILKQEGKIPSNIKFCWLLAKDPAPQREKLLALMNKHGIMESVKIQNSVKRNELFKLIHDTDYVIIPSITEGFGFCAVEACWLKKKIIYSSGGSLPEVVFGECLMFQNRNARDLADKISSVISNKEGVFDLIPEKEFKKERMIQEIIKMYKSLVTL